MHKLKGILYVAIAAASYGLLATVVKFANLQGLETAVLTFYQYFLAAVILSFWALKWRQRSILTGSEKLKLALVGISFGLTSSFYYLSIQYVPVSIAIILLMQTIWLGVVVEIILTQKKVEPLKLIGAAVVLVGTFLAVDALDNLATVNGKGLMFGLLAACSFTVVLTGSNRVAVHLPIIQRSQYMVLGGLLTVLLFWNLQILSPQLISPKTLSYGLFLALFGTLIPPVLFNKGFPIIGIGLGSILTAIEIPVSIISAHWLLDEQLKMIQWLGVAIIITSVVIINYRHLGDKQS